MLNKRIRYILGKYEEARSNDKLLILKVWESYGFYLSETQRKIFMDLPSSESIRRTRQALQAQGLYKSDNKTAQRRRFKGMSVRQRIYGTRAEKIAPLLDERIL